MTKQLRKKRVWKLSVFFRNSGITYIHSHTTPKIIVNIGKLKTSNIGTDKSAA